MLRNILRRTGNIKTDQTRKDKIFTKSGQFICFTDAMDIRVVEPFTTRCSKCGTDRERVESSGNIHVLDSVRKQCYNRQGYQRDDE